MISPAMAFDDDIGERLEAIRLAKGYTNKAAWCRLVGISDQAWNNYVKGWSGMSVDQALKVVEVSGVSLDWIFRGIRKDLPDDVREFVNTTERRS